MVNRESSVLSLVVFCLTLIGTAFLLGCSGPDTYYMGQDKETIGEYLGAELLPGHSQAWAQAFRPADYKVVIMIAKIRSDQVSAEDYCRLLQLNPSSFSEALMSPLPITNRDVDAVAQWWDPPGLLNAQSVRVCYANKTTNKKDGGHDMRAMWERGYLYIYKQGRIGLDKSGNQ